MAFYPSMVLIVGPTRSACQLAETLRLTPGSFKTVHSLSVIMGLVFNEVHFTHDVSDKLKREVETRARVVAPRAVNGSIKVVDHYHESVTELWLKHGLPSYEISYKFPMGMVPERPAEPEPVKSILGVIGWFRRGRRF